MSFRRNPHCRRKFECHADTLEDHAPRAPTSAVTRTSIGQPGVVWNLSCAPTSNLAWTTEEGRALIDEGVDPDDLRVPLGHAWVRLFCETTGSGTATGLGDKPRRSRFSRSSGRDTAVCWHHCRT